MTKISGLYQNAKPDIVNEEHGGGQISVELWNFLCFYSDGRVGYYSAGKNSVQWYYRFDELDIKGNVLSYSDNIITFNLLNSFNNRLQIFVAERINNVDFRILKIDNLPNDQIFSKVEFDFESYSQKNGFIAIQDTYLLDDKGIPTAKRVFYNEHFALIEAKEGLVKIIVNNDPKQTGWLRREDIQFWKI